MKVQVFFKWVETTNLLFFFPEGMNVHFVCFFLLLLATLWLGVPFLPRIFMHVCIPTYTTRQKSPGLIETPISLP